MYNHCIVLEECALVHVHVRMWLCVYSARLMPYTHTHTRTHTHTHTRTHTHMHTHSHTHTHTHPLAVRERSHQLFIPHEYSYLNAAVLEGRDGFVADSQNSHFVLKKRPHASQQLRSDVIQRGGVHTHTHTHTHTRVLSNTSRLPSFCFQPARISHRRDLSSKTDTCCRDKCLRLQQVTMVTLVMCALVLCMFLQSLLLSPLFGLPVPVNPFPFLAAPAAHKESGVQRSAVTSLSLRHHYLTLFSSC